MLLTITSISAIMVHLPAKAPKEYKKYLKKDVVVTQKILIAKSLFSTNLSWREEDISRPSIKNNLIKTLNPGDMIKIISYKSINLPAGEFFRFKCIDNKSGIKFYLQEQHLDCIKLK